MECRQGLVGNYKAILRSKRRYDWPAKSQRWTSDSGILPITTDPCPLWCTEINRGSASRWDLAYTRLTANSVPEATGQEHSTVPTPPAPQHSPTARRQEAVLERRRSAPANQKSPAALQASHRIGHRALPPAPEARFSDWERREIFLKRSHWWKMDRPLSLPISDWPFRGEGDKLRDDYWSLLRDRRQAGVGARVRTGAWWRCHGDMA